MKRAVAVLILLLLMGCASGETIGQGIENVLDGMELKTLEEKSGTENLRGLLSDLAQGNAVFDAESVLDALKKTMDGEMKLAFRRVPGLLAPALLCALAGVMRKNRDAIARLCENACFLSLAAVMASDLKTFLTEAENAVLRMSEMMQALFPLLLVLLAAVGAEKGAAILQPAVSAAGSTMTTFVRSVSLPLCTGMATVTLLDSLSESMRLKHLSNLLRSMATWTLGIAFTVFIGVTAMQGLTAAAADGVGIRAAKYAVDHFVPVVGGMFADTMDTLVGCSLMIKNALGATGLVLLLSVAGVPLIRTLSAALMYRVCSALLQPVAQDRVANALRGFSDALMLLLAIQLSVGAMFLLLVAQVLAAGNFTVALR